METHSINSADQAGPPFDIVLRGRTKKSAALLGQFLFTLCIIACVVATALPHFNNAGQQDSSSYIMLVLLLGYVLYSAAVGTFRQWRYPPFVEIQGRQLRMQLAGPPVTTDVTNIQQVFMVAGHLCIGFRDMRLVDSSNPAATRKFLVRQYQAAGCHFATPRGMFDLAQMNSLRHALGQPAQESDEREQRLSEFETGLKRATPRTWVTASIVVINILVFVFLLIADARKTGLAAHIVSNVSPELILDWGGNYPPLTVNGQQWRLLTCVFLHWTMIHLAFNMWVLYDIGRLVERTIGSIPFLLVYLFSGVCGSLTTVYWSTFSRTVLSAGASGAVFGMFGLMLGMLRQPHREFPAELIRSHKASCLGFVGFNLVFGLTMPNVDMAAHLGGLAGGLLCGLVARPILPPRPIPSLSARLALLIPLCLIVTTAGIWFLPTPETDFAPELNTFLAIEQKLNGRLSAIISEAGSKMTPAETVQRLRADVIDPWRKERERLSSLKNVKHEDRAALKAVLRYMTLREESFDLLSQSIGEKDASKQERGIAKQAEAQAVLEDWVRNDGQRFGLSVQDRPMETEY